MLLNAFSASSVARQTHEQWWKLFIIDRFTTKPREGLWELPTSSLHADGLTALLVAGHQKVLPFTTPKIRALKQSVHICRGTAEQQWGYSMLLMLVPYFSALPPFQRKMPLCKLVAFKSPLTQVRLK